MAAHKPGFSLRTYFDAQGRESRYSVFVPHAYDPTRTWPLILFLHGAGETGNDGVKPTRVGIGPAIVKREHDFPFLTLFPQARRGTWRAGLADAEVAMAILRECMLEFAADPKRIHLTGISMGGYGTWSLAAAHPEIWASITPVCGGGDATKAGVIKHIPCWAFHGDADNIIPVEESRRMIEALRKAGAEPRYTEFPEVAHKSWDQAYATPALFDWMLAAHRP